LSICASAASIALARSFLSSAIVLSFYPQCVNSRIVAAGRVSAGPFGTEKWVSHAEDELQPVPEVNLLWANDLQR